MANTPCSFRNENEEKKTEYKRVIKEFNVYSDVNKNDLQTIELVVIDVVFVVALTLHSVLQNDFFLCE